MPTLSTAARNAACNAIVDLLDAGTTVTYPYVKFEASNHAEVALCNFTGATAFGSANTGVATAGTIGDDTSAAGGTVAHVGLYDQDNTEIITCTIATTSSADFQLASLTVGVGDTIGVSSLTVTVPA